MKIAIAHDYLNQYGGAERVIESFHEIFPSAPIYTSIYLAENMPESFKKMDIRTSFMQKLPFLNKHFKRYLLVYPKAFESFNLNEYDLILSSSSAFAKGVNKNRNACHVCYCYSPMRFVWEYQRYVEKEKFGTLIRKILPSFVSILKSWDLKVNKNVNFFISISKNIQKKIETCYCRQSDVIYPPVTTDNFKISNNIGNYFLLVSRLNAYKRIDLVVEAFNQLKLPLKIVGDGPSRKNLENLAGPTVEFFGKVDEDRLAEIYSKCQAFIFPGEEDFGIAPVEAQASGRPVIAYAQGGALETVIDEETGIFFKDQTVESLIEAIMKYNRLKNTFNPQMIRENALRFDKEIFKRQIKTFIEEKYNEYQQRNEEKFVKEGILSI